MRSGCLFATAELLPHMLLHGCSRRYELPLYVICAPTNLVRESGKRGSSAQLTASGGGAVELPAVAAGAGSAAGSGGGGSPTPDSHPETAPLNQVAVR